MLLAVRCQLIVAVVLLGMSYLKLLFVWLLVLVGFTISIESVRLVLLLIVRVVRAMFAHHARTITCC